MQHFEAYLKGSYIFSSSKTSLINYPKRVFFKSYKKCEYMFQNLFVPTLNKQHWKHMQKDASMHADLFFLALFVISISCRSCWYLGIFSPTKEKSINFFRRFRTKKQTNDFVKLRFLLKQIACEKGSWVEECLKFPGNF